MSAQHTPGPWHVGEGMAARLIYDARGWPIADAKVFHGNTRAGEDHHNARLIAAAPELLEALAVLLVVAEIKCGNTDAAANAAFAHARAAIAKATGAPDPTPSKLGG